MSAKKNANNKAIQLVIQHAFDTTVTKGVYELNLNNRYFSPTGNYVIADSIFYGSGVIPNSSIIKIEILAITQSTVTGTFSGKFNNTDKPNDNVVITNGEFYLPVQ